MWRTLCRKIYFDWMGWKTEITVRPYDKCILCVAPHTSNWDFIVAELYYTAIGRRAEFLMKREWFFWPLGLLWRRMGGIPVDRSRKTSLTDQLAERAKNATHFELAVTPEGELEARLLFHRLESQTAHTALCHRLPTKVHHLHT